MSAPTWMRPTGDRWCGRVRRPAHPVAQPVVELNRLAAASLVPDADLPEVLAELDRLAQDPALAGYPFSRPPGPMCWRGWAVRWTPERRTKRLSRAPTTRQSAASCSVDSSTVTAEHHPDKSAERMGIGETGDYQLPRGGVSVDEAGGHSGQGRDHALLVIREALAAAGVEAREPRDGVFVFDLPGSASSPRPASSWSVSMPWPCMRSCAATRTRTTKASTTGCSVATCGCTASPSASTTTVTSTSTGVSPRPSPRMRSTASGFGAVLRRRVVQHHLGTRLRLVDPQGVGVADEPGRVHPQPGGVPRLARVRRRLTPSHCNYQNVAVL